MFKYDIVVGSHKNLNTAIAQVEKEVNKLLNEGWKIQGPIEIFIDNSSDSMKKMYNVVREMVKETED